MSKPRSKKVEDASSKGGADSRFANFQTDPRFRLPSTRKTKVTIDKRFSRMLEDEEFTGTSRVDRYGRKLKSDSKKKALQRLYQQEEGEEDEPDDDEVVRKELKAAKARYDPARGGGFSSSESDSESEDEGEEDAAVDIDGSMQRLQDEQADVEAGEVTNRLAIVNLDWDHVNAVDLFALFSSFLPPNGGKVVKVTVYPSEFGKERMAREELEGPPRDIFKAKNNEDDGFEDDDADEDSDDEEADRKLKESLIKEGDDGDFDHAALRSYQLDRLRYYYAVMTCSDKATAKNIYDTTDGREYQASSNLIDLRFVPDDVTFDDEPRDFCDNMPTDYKALNFITDALQHSKVKLTWDLTPDELTRKDTINRKFKGGRDEIEKNDLRAYLASDSEDEENLEPLNQDQDGGPEGTKLTKKEIARQKMRAALGLTDGEASTSAKDGPVGDMQITFSAALTEGISKEPEHGETTIEKYKRKEKERKEKRREKSGKRRDGEPLDANAGSQDGNPPGDDLGFDDPFFTAEEPKEVSKSASRKEARRKRREHREDQETGNDDEKANLELLMMDDQEGGAARLEHFDMNEIMKAEKQKKKKKKHRKDEKSQAGLQRDFEMDVKDERFKAMFENHEFAIDPSHPKFKATEGMKKLLEEGRRKRKTTDGGDSRAPRSKKKPKYGDAELGSLVRSVKIKSSSKK